MEKTNVIRLLEKEKITFNTYTYDESIVDGLKVANTLNENPEQVFKTLVTIGNDKNYYVFCVPVWATLNLKKAAKSAGVKSIEMIKQKDLYPLTGYIHGGCSPLMMKKQFRTFMDETATLFDDIFVSGGKVGLQIKIKISDLIKLIPITFVDLID